jgi:hypothetical protein
VNRASVIRRVLTPPKRRSGYANDELLESETKPLRRSRQRAYAHSHVIEALRNRSASMTSTTEPKEA